MPEEGRRIKYLKRSSINVPNDDRSGQHEPAIREELILATVQCCLRTLVDRGVVREDQLQRRYSIDWSSSDRLRSLELAAATSEDAEGRAILKLDAMLPLLALVWTIPHEAVHIAQICRGDLRFPPHGGTHWTEL